MEIKMEAKMEKKMKKKSIKKLLVQFGNYMLSVERDETLCKTDGDGNFLNQNKVTDADLANFTQLVKNQKNEPNEKV